MWLIDQNILQAMRGESRADISSDIIMEHHARASSAAAAVGSTGHAHVVVKGVLTESPDIMAMLFGGGNTTYNSVIEALAAADADANVDRIRMEVDSPGGTVSGLFEALAAMENVKKPIDVIGKGRVASAAYALASAGDTLTASSPATAFGSIGTLVSMKVNDTVVNVTSSNAPKKSNDPRTAEGVTAIREELDAYEELFIDAIAQGRNTTPEKVKADFGQGGMLLAEEAKKRGMIDTLQTSSNTKTNTAANASGTPENIMDLATLKAQHGDVYAAAVQEGIEKERERAGAHLIMGEASGDMATAIAAVTAGDEMTPIINARYAAAAMKRGAIEARQEEDEESNLGDLTNQTTAEDQASNILALAAESCGVELSGGAA